MKILSPSLIELPAFLAVCRQGSFRRAADDLCVTQAAVSRAVQRLEEHLAAGRLFERSPAGVVLTPRGAQWRKLVERLVLALESAAETLGRASRPRLVRLSVIPTLSIQWLMPRLPGFHERSPGVKVELRQFRHDEDFTRDDVDLWLDVKRPSRRWPERIQTRYLIGRELIPVCTARLAKAYRTPRDLQGATLLHHTNFPDNWARWFAKAGAPCTPRLGPAWWSANCGPASWSCRSTARCHPGAATSYAGSATPPPSRRGKNSLAGSWSRHTPGAARGQGDKVFELERDGS